VLAKSGVRLWQRIECVPIAGLQVPVAQYIPNAVQLESVIVGLVGDALDCDLGSSRTVVCQGVPCRAAETAFPPKRARLINLRERFDLPQKGVGLVKAQDERHSPSERKLDRHLAVHQLRGELTLPGDQRQEIAFRNE